MVSTRRHVLRSSLALAATSLLPGRYLRAQAAPRFSTDPFTLGVASGYPTASSVVLWTRLAPNPAAPGGGMPPAVVPIKWELAKDDRMKAVVQSGIAFATPEWAHSVHPEPYGLEAGRDYWYRFTAGDVRSPIGRTRTAPDEGSATPQLRIAVASCQQYEQGYYTAYRHMLDDDLDLVLHVGDYIYEQSWGNQLVRSHAGPETYSLDDYRARYALYKSDPDLAAAHAAYPWLVVWDDHEVDNDYAGDVSEQNDDPAPFRARRAAAYRAYYEHMPLPRQALPFDSAMRLHARRAFGDLANLFMLDQRQYRSPEACPRPGKGGGNRVSDCPELQRQERTILGERQESWLSAELTTSKARWNVMAQGTMMSYLDEDPGPGTRFWTDGWNGYPAARERLMKLLAERGTPNPVVLSGDIHAFLVANLQLKGGVAESPIVASEFVTTSISSQAGSLTNADGPLAANPNVLFGSGEYRGYLRMHLTREHLKADLVGLDTVKQRGSARRVIKSFAVEAGRPGAIAG